MGLVNIAAGAAPDTRFWAALFGGEALPAAEVGALNALVRPRSVAAGALVFQQGEPAPTLLALVAGDVVLGISAEVGSFRSERHLHAPAWLDLSAGWLGDGHALEARTLTPVTLLELPRDGLLSLLEHTPALARRLIMALAIESRLLSSSAHDLMHKSAPARLAAWLDQHCVGTDGDGASSGLVLLTIRKRDIASLLAIAPETLSRLMRSLSRQGVIRVAGYTVHVLNRPALAEMARD